MSSAAFEGLLASMFDAYRPEKWSSNVYTRERLEVKQRLLSLERALQPAFEGLDLKRMSSDEYPSVRNTKKVDAQWVFLSRNEEEQRALERVIDLEKTLATTLADSSPMIRHAFLCLRLDQEGLEVSFRLHSDAWVDRRNLQNKVADSAHLASFVELVRALPPPSSVGMVGEPPLSPEQATEETLAALVERHGSAEDQGFLRFGVVFDRAKVVEQGSGLPEVLRPHLEAAIALYRFATWSEENDFVRSDEVFLEKREKRGERRRELKANEAEHRAHLDAKHKEQDAARKELEELFRHEAHARANAPRRPRPQSTAPSREGASEDTRGPRKTQKPATAPKPKRKSPPPPTPTVPLEVQAGHQARVSNGPLAGQVGLVQEVDARGTARIMVGLLATRIPVEDLVGLGPVTEKK